MEPSNLYTKQFKQKYSRVSFQVRCVYCISQYSYLKEELSAPQVLSQEIQHPHHLGEYENSVAPLLQTHQQLVQQN